MGRYVKADHEKIYLCAWKCANCGKFNVSVGAVSGSSTAGYGIIGMSKEEATKYVKDVAAATASGKIEQISRQVNEKQVFYRLQITGKCSACGCKQLWGLHYQYRWIKYMLMLLVFIGTFVLMNNIDSAITRICTDALGDVGKYVLFILLAVPFAASYIISSIFNLGLNRWINHRMRETDDIECWPLVAGGNWTEQDAESDQRAILLRNSWESINNAEKQNN